MRTLTRQDCLRRRLTQAFRVAIACTTCLLLSACRAPLPAAVRVAFLDVGQGDCTVIETPRGKVVVIDGGGVPATDERDGADPGHRILLPYLRFRGIQEIDMLVATHPDEDHVQGLSSVAGHYRIQRAFLGGDFSKGASGRLKHKLRTRAVPTSSLVRGQSIRVDDTLRLDVLHPGRTRVSNSRSPDNDHGIVLRLVAGSSTAMLTGDIEDAAERELMESGVRLDAQLLKVGHHGSRGSTSMSWLARVGPRWAVVSAGRRNRFGHPTPEVLGRLDKYRIGVWRTDHDGAVVALATRGGWEFRTGPFEQPRGSADSFPDIPPR